MGRDQTSNSIPLVSIIIPNWNGKRFLEECLHSIEKQTFCGFEVIFVDNGSTDGSAEWVEERYGHWVRIIRNRENLGFAEGNNVGIRVARGMYIVLLNNDTVVEPDWLEELIKPVEGDSTVGMCASKVRSYDQPKVLEATGELLFRDGLNRARGHLEVDRGQYDSDLEIFFPPGCGGLYRKVMLDEIGLFDEDFFAYGDDTDLGIRGRLAGWRCVYAPRAVVYHKGSGSTGRYSPFKAFHVERNRIWIAVKYFPLHLLLMTPFYTLLRYFFQAYGSLAHQGAAGRYTRDHSIFSLFLILLRAYGSATKYFIRMWRKRKALRRLRRVRNGEFSEWLRCFGISAKAIALMD
jgi:GT2 family glycosyltransferase